ncbi:MAG: hypothetical protein AB7E60_10710 [Sphingobium sp.]
MAALELNDQGLECRVYAFCPRVRADAALDPVVDDAIADWPLHPWHA